MARQASFDRNETLKKAMDLFWTNGYQGTSMKDLETALDLRPGSIYSAFGSKEKLYAEALDFYFDVSSGQLRQTLASASSPLEGLAAHVRRLGCVSDAEPPSRACMLVKTILELPRQEASLRAKTEKLIQETETVFREAFLAAQESGEVDAAADPDLLAARLQSEVFGLRAYAQRSDAAEIIPRLAELIAKDLEALRVQEKLSWR